MTEEIWEHLSTVEEEAEAILKKARSESFEMLSKTRHQLLAERERTLEEARALGEDMLSQGVEAARSDADKTRVNAISDVEELKNSVRQRMPDVVQFIVEEFLG